MPQPAVVFDRVWKKFRTGERHDSLRDLIPSLLKRRNGTALSDREFWAVRNVSFEVQPGEALGIIGPNGGGKSTTLKLLTKILRPNRGHCHVIGRVGALIEVAAGFHPDLTGLENIYLQGAIMGMKRAEIARKLEEIVEFAGVRNFIDTPVKRYSSGMNARLGFSIAAHLEPDVLIIDEVLSVGDVSFQERCVKRMQDFKREGVTIVFVSHNLQAVSALCDTAVFLQQEVRAVGPTDGVLRTYVQSQPRPVVTASAGTVCIEGARLRGTAGSAVDVLQPGQRVELHIACKVIAKTEDVTFGLMLYRSTDRLILYEGHYTDAELGLTSLTPGASFTVSFAFDVNLVRGEYYAECWVLHNPTHSFLSILSPAAMFSVDENRTTRGIIDIGLTAHVLHGSAEVIHG